MHYPCRSRHPKRPVASWNALGGGGVDGQRHQDGRGWPSGSAAVHRHGVGAAGDGDVVAVGGLV
ncbi:MAG TPA: hypothetical protein VIQ02_10155, partial [Jiangellaceae bacterium]